MGNEGIKCLIASLSLIPKEKTVYYSNFKRNITLI